MQIIITVQLHSPICVKNGMHHHQEMSDVERPNCAKFVASTS